MKISLLAAITSLAAISCGGGAAEAINSRDGGADGGAVIACSSDMQCGNSGACVGKRCVQRVGKVDSWIVEVTAPPPSAPAPPPGTYGPLVTELGSVGEPPVVLTAGSTPDLVVQFGTDPASAATIPSTASVIVTVPSAIPGRPDLSFQALLNSTKASATLMVSESVVGRPATVNLIPLSPSDVNTPPYTFLDVPIPMSGPLNVTLTVPPASFKISGQVVDSLNAPQGNFTARAFQNGLLASTTAVTSVASGAFTIYLPAGSGPVNLELLPPSGAAEAWLTLAQIPLTQAPKELGPIALPAHASANAFRVMVHGNNPDLTPVAGASVHAIASVVGGDTRAKFLRDGSTDANGNTQLTLIPGDSQNAVTYTFSVVPPAGSPWASQSVGGVPVLWNGSTTPAIQDFTLVPRAVVSGTLLSSDGSPVTNAVVTATRGAAAASECVPGPATTSVITDAKTGAFQLALDPGCRYQFDYDPPDGSAAPRWTEYDVLVNGDLPKPVRLPPPALLEGDVQDADGQPLPSATIRVFEPRACQPTGPCPPPPRLRGETQSGDAQSAAPGHFRFVVAPP
jgi:hypothetical protein